MLDPLLKEGLTSLEIIGVLTNATSWDQRAPGFDQVKLPLLLDTKHVFEIYSADSYDVILVDKKSRLVTKESFLDTDEDALLNNLSQRIRELYAE